MTTLRPIELLIENLGESFPAGVRGYCSKEEALAHLRQLTGQDFGFNIKAWRKWYKADRQRLEKVSSAEALQKAMERYGKRTEEVP